MPTLTMTPCDSCLTPVLSLPLTVRPGLDEILCPACTARITLEGTAADHLHALLYPTVLAWAQHWAAAGVSVGGLSGALALEGFHWHPEGARYRGQDDPQTSAAAVIREALALAEARHE